MAKNKGILQEIESRSGAFALVFLLLFGLTFGFLALVGATPEAPSTSATPPAPTRGDVQQPTPQGVTNQPTTQVSAVAQSKLPIHISIKKIGVDTIVLNPKSTNVAALDRELLKGAVRYPTSGLLGERGTVLLFGHSSYLPVIRNPAYKAFSRIQELKAGDIVSVYSGDTEYQFSVTAVHRADANTDIVELPQDGQYLTLVTCDTFSKKSNRFIVTTKLAGTYRL